MKHARYSTLFLPLLILAALASGCLPPPTLGFSDVDEQVVDDLEANHDKILRAAGFIKAYVPEDASGTDGALARFEEARSSHNDVVTMVKRHVEGGDDVIVEAFARDIETAQAYADSFEREVRTLPTEGQSIWPILSVAYDAYKRFLESLGQARAEQARQITEPLFVPEYNNIPALATGG